MKLLVCALLHLRLRSTPPFFHLPQTSGYSLTAQEPYNNIIRTTVEVSCCQAACLLLFPRLPLCASHGSKG